MSKEIFNQQSLSPEPPRISISTSPTVGPIIQMPSPNSAMNNPILVQAISGNQQLQSSNSQNFQQIIMPGTQQILIPAPNSGPILQTSDGQTIQVINQEGTNFVQTPQGLVQLPAGSTIVNQQNSTASGSGGGGSNSYFVIYPNSSGNLQALQRFPIITSNDNTEEEPLYVNAKQYNRIIKRRLARAKLVQQGKIPKTRRKYLHESRHRHAMNRARGEGGRFHSLTNKDDHDGFETNSDDSHSNLIANINFKSN